MDERYRVPTQRERLDRVNPPGSMSAIKQGCTCAIMDNCRGAGIMGNGERNGWWISADCPLHAAAPEAPAHE